VRRLDAAFACAACYYVQMKRVLLAFLIIVLILLELWLLESFLPSGWHHPIDELLQHIFPLQPYDPHPRMDLEFESALRQHLSWRIGIYLAGVALALGNGFAISKVWSAFRRSASR
jgi:hypothetical protein